MGEVIARIPLTGGPKGGKTKIIEESKKMIEKEYGCKVFVVHETATEIINSGFIPWPKPKDNNPEDMELFYETNKIFQNMILQLQLAKEAAFEKAAKAWPGDVVILYDRAVMDNDGYLRKNLRNKELFKRMLMDYRLTVDDIMNRYDGVISLETSATINDFNTKEEDDPTKRIEEDNKEALEVDYYVSQVWESHPNYIRINARESFEDKINDTLMALRSILNKKKAKRLVKKD